MWYSNSDCPILTYPARCACPLTDQRPISRSKSAIPPDFAVATLVGSANKC